MDRGTQNEMPLSKVLDVIINEVGADTLSFYHPSRDFIISDSVITSEEAKKITLD
jgi:hypothetical protein